jgi:hypothetical protein
MKTRKTIQIIALAGLPCLLLTACQTNQTATNPQQPGPMAGHAFGAGVGAVAGNVAGATVAVGEGVAAGAAAPFSTPATNNVQEFRTVVNPDGSTSRVPVTVTVDQYGRVINSPAPGR